MFAEFFGRPEVKNVLSAAARGFLSTQPGGNEQLATIDAQRAKRAADAKRQSLFAQATQGLDPAQAARFQLLSQDGLDESFAAKYNPTELDRKVSTFQQGGGADFLRALFANEAGLDSSTAFLSRPELAGAGRVGRNLVFGRGIQDAVGAGQQDPQVFGSVLATDDNIRSAVSIQVSGSNRLRALEGDWIGGDGFESAFW